MTLGADGSTAGPAAGAAPTITGTPSDVVATLPPGTTLKAVTLVAEGATLAGLTIGGAATISGTPTDGAPTGTGLDAAAQPNGPLKVGQSLGPRYHIIKVLGIGGMGAVYQAWDAELGVAVALKVIRVDERRAATSAAEKQFKQELLLARQVTHKNVVRIHDLGEIDGIKYITMPYVQGRDLATLLREGGKLPIAQALRLARDIAGGLEAAHEAGVVHRDLKPANIMISGPDDGRHALIMDFGISASADSAASDTVVGTLEYMAPEQVKGIADARADVYAFGLILYEMLTGLRTIPDTTARGRVDAMKQRIATGLVPVRSLDASIPDPLDALVTKCLATDPAARFANAGELNEALAGLADTGRKIPVAARLTKKMGAAGFAVVAVLLVGTFYTAKRLTAPVKPHDPVVVVIADFENQTGDPTFDHTLEQTMRRGLEGVGFINAYDRSRIRGALGVPPPAKLDEDAVRKLAIGQGFGVALAGSIAGGAQGYEISVKATQPRTGQVIVSTSGRAASKNDVLGATAKLAVSVRQALGDKTATAAQALALANMSAASFDAVSSYAAGVYAASNGKNAEAFEQYSKAVQMDPKFGLAYQGLAGAARNLGRPQDAEKYATEALRYISSMTARERLSTRGNVYRQRGDYQQCVKEYGDLIAEYPVDAGAHNQRAICLANLRRMKEAVEDMQQAARIVPNNVAFRMNLALYAARSGDFDRADKELGAIPELEAHAVAVRALTQLGRGQLQEAAETYRQLAKMGPWGTSYAASGLGDLASYEGRFSDAIRIFSEGADADIGVKGFDDAATKLTALGHVYLARGERAAAVKSAERALQYSHSIPVRFLAARVLVQAGAIDKARPVAAELSGGPSAEPQTYGKIIEGEIALASGNTQGAIKLLTDANAIVDTWIGRFDLGQAYLKAEQPTEADSQFDRCITRRAETLSLMGGDPTYGYFPPVYFYEGRARESFKAEGYADLYREYLKVRGNSTEDPLVPEARKHSGQ
jgi:tetratricopeptide (TPR) repeat protein